jgi:hypothetical protein
VKQVPEFFCTATRQGVLNRERAAQTHDICCGVAALDALPTGVGGPIFSNAAICCSRLSCSTIFCGMTISLEVVDVEAKDHFKNLLHRGNSKSYIRLLKYSISYTRHLFIHSISITYTINFS